MTNAARPKALVYARGTDVVVPVPALLSRAGFDVTLVTHRPELRGKT